MGKVIIVSGPSGSGKSTLIKHLMSKIEKLVFSISATSRLPRGEEHNGVEYYFLTPAEFRKRIDHDDFVEWEEVYAGRFYGTLKTEVTRIWETNKIVLFDVDVKGAVNIKKEYGDQALSILIQAPDITELRMRLIARNTDSPEEIERRVGKAEYERSFADKFDRVVINDDLQEAKDEIVRIVTDFIS